MLSFKSFLTGTLTCILLYSCAGLPGVENRRLENRITRIESGIQPAVVSRNGPSEPYHIISFMEKLSVPGVSLTVVNDNRSAWSKAYGVREDGGAILSTDDPMQAGSISMPVVAMAVLRLVEDGVFDLDADVNGYLNTWCIPDTGLTSVEKVTLRRLLSHTSGVTSSGVDDGGPAGEAPTLAAILTGDFPGASGPVIVEDIPGSTRRYSNEGYAIIQQILVDRLDRPFPEIMKEYVLVPLGMEHSTFEQPPASEFYDSAASGHIGDREPIQGKGFVYRNMAAGGLWSTTEDLSRFLIELQNALEGKSSLLSRPSAQLMLYDPKTEHGLGFDVANEGRGDTFGHFGHNMGFNARLIGTITCGKGIIVMTNSNTAIPLLEGLTYAVAAEYDWPDSVSPELIDEYEMTTDELETYTGEYAIGDYVVTIMLAADRLRISHFEGDDELIPVSPTVFRQRLDGITINFVIDDGEVRALSLFDGMLVLERVGGTA